MQIIHLGRVEYAVLLLRVSLCTEQQERRRKERKSKHCITLCISVLCKRESWLIFGHFFCTNITGTHIAVWYGRGASTVDEKKTCRKMFWGKISHYNGVHLSILCSIVNFDNDTLAIGTRIIIVQWYRQSMACIATVAHKRNVYSSATKIHCVTCLVHRTDLSITAIPISCSMSGRGQRTAALIGRSNIQHCAYNFANCLVCTVQTQRGSQWHNSILQNIRICRQAVSAAATKTTEAFLIDEWALSVFIHRAEPK